MSEIKRTRTILVRLYPTTSQEHRLLSLAEAHRWMWNWAIDEAARYYREHKKGIPKGGPDSLGQRWTKLRRDRPSLSDIPRRVFEGVQEDIDRSYALFFSLIKGKQTARAGKPIFKPYGKDAPSFAVTYGVGYSADGRVTAFGLGAIRARGNRSPLGTVNRARFFRDRAGDWHAALTDSYLVQGEPLAPIDHATFYGIDLGLEDFAILDTGEKIANPEFYRRGEARLAQAQRALSRKKRGSANHAKAAQRVARASRTVANQRSDFLHRTSRTLVAASSGLAIEDLSVTGLIAIGNAKRINDASWSAFRRLLTYKSAWENQPLVAIDRYFPSSKTCFDCGFIKEDLTTADRVWTCPRCGAVHDRDTNAARNIRAVGLRQLNDTPLARQEAA